MRAGSWRTKPVSKTFVLRVIPVAKPRMTQRDKWAKRPAVLRYFAFADAFRAEAQRVGFVLPDFGAAFTFYLPIPSSWSAKKKREMEGKPHQSRPDLDNLAKSAADALKGEDSTIWQYNGLTKLWSSDPRIEVVVS